MHKLTILSYYISCVSMMADRAPDDAGAGHLLGGTKNGAESRRESSFRTPPSFCLTCADSCARCARRDAEASLGGRRGVRITLRGTEGLEGGQAC